MPCLAIESAAFYTFGETEGTYLKRSSLSGANSQLTRDLWISCKEGDIWENHDFTMPLRSEGKEWNVEWFDRSVDGDSQASDTTQK